MKKVVMMAPYFPPRRRVGSSRPFRFAVRLRQFGYEPVVVTLSSPGELTNQEQDLLGNIRIIRINPPFDRTVKKPVNSEKNRKEKPREGGFINRISDWVDWHIPADSWLPLFMLNRSKILKELRPLKPDLVWSTGDPWSSHWLGLKLAANLRLPWIADFRDPWTLASVPLRKRSRFSEMADRRMEKKVIASADSVVFTAESTKKRYEEAYGDTILAASVIYNSSDPDLQQDDTEKRSSRFREDEKLNLLFFGTFRRLSPVDSVLALLKELEAISQSLSKKLVIHSFGTPDPSEMDKVTDAGFLEQFRFHDRVLPEQTRSILDIADLLLLSSHPKRDEIIPAKLWDYLSSGRPVLSLLANDEAGEIISSAGSGVHFGTGQSKKGAKWLADLIRQGTVPERADSGDLSRYSADYAARQLAELMEELT